MIRFKDISIPKPCSVDYDALPGDEIKRFCGSCEKHVYDFRGKDEAHLNNIYQQSPKTCGVFYVDDIRNFKKADTNKFLLRIVSLLIFIKSFLNTHDSSAAELTSQTITEQTTTTDSTNKVKVIYKSPKNRNISRSRHQINIYINDTLYESAAYPKNGYLYLPDTIQVNDKIKIKIFANKTVKARTYKFNYTDISDITIKIVGKKPIRIFKRRTYVGCPANFW